MIVFPNCKINLGLYITQKRDDGFHNLETIFYPIKGLTDALEIQLAEEFSCTVTGVDLHIATEDNIVVKAYRLLQKDFDLEPIHIHLHKNIPHGAGLGGGSADASFMLMLCNDFFRLDLSNRQLMDYANVLGSDCAFFIINQACVGKGRGELLTPIDINLFNYQIVLIKPAIYIATKDAFSGIVPAILEIDWEQTISQPIQTWQQNIENQFEKTVGLIHPIILEIKNKLYAEGALYASMTGTGSVVFGIFENEIDVKQFEQFGEVYVG
jgi:4-diphosphocytidyl-2-C-methyl-D-erythritol kinase